jgi:hypothetical protein
LQSSEVFFKLPNLFLQLFVFFNLFSNRGWIIGFQPKFESLKSGVLIYQCSYFVLSRLIVGVKRGCKVKKFFTLQPNFYC